MSSDVFRTNPEQLAEQYPSDLDSRWAALTADDSEPDVADAFVFRFSEVDEQLDPDQRWSTWLDVERGSRGPHSCLSHDPAGS